MRKSITVALRIAAVIITLPLTFFGILFGWGLIDRIVGYREVSAFIEEHQEMVDKWCRSPNVHSFSLTHEPENTSQLLIQFDVERKQTYEALEDELFKDTLSLTFDPSWKTRLRSNENLEGFILPRFGFDELLRRLFVALVASFVAFGIAIWLNRRYEQRRNSRISHESS